MSTTLLINSPRVTTISKPQISIVEYDESIATNEEIASLYLANHNNSCDLGTIKGVHFTQRARFGILIYLAYFAIIDLKYQFGRLILQNYWDNTLSIEGISLISSIVIFYLTYSFVAYKNLQDHYQFGLKVYDTDFMKSSVKNKYMTSPENRFWLATIPQENKIQPEVIGTLGLIGYKEDPNVKTQAPDRMWLAQMAEKLKESTGDKSPVKMAYLLRIGLLDKYRGMGISNKMMEKAIEFAKEKGYNYATLGTLEMNLPMAGLAKKFGFNTSHYYTYTSFLGIGTRGHFMVKKL